MLKILTVCRAGLIRSNALANVLKLHFKPVDVLACGIGEHSLGRMNQEDTLKMLFEWADKIIVMETRYKEKIFPQYQNKVFICDVGADVWNNCTHPDLINKVFIWARLNAQKLGVTEHNEIL